MKTVEVWIDGACEPKNPGGTASWGAYFTYAGVPLEDWGIVGSGEGMSNNVAEYAALIEALNIAKSRYGAAIHLMVYGDSQLVINQMNREWEIGRAMYTEYAQRALHLALQFQKLTFTWIPRERNTFADALSKRALAEKGIKPHYLRR